MKTVSDLLLARGPGSVKETLHRQESCIDVQVLIYLLWDHSVYVGVLVHACDIVIAKKQKITSVYLLVSLKLAHTSDLQGTELKLSNLFFHVMLPSLFFEVSHITNTLPISSCVDPCCSGVPLVPFWRDLDLLSNQAL